MKKAIVYNTAMLNAKILNISSLKGVKVGDTYTAQIKTELVTLKILSFKEKPKRCFGCKMVFDESDEICHFERRELCRSCYNKRVIKKRLTNKGHKPTNPDFGNLKAIVTPRPSKKHPWRHAGVK